MYTFRRHAEVVAVLSDSRFQVARAPQTGEGARPGPGGIAGAAERDGPGDVGASGIAGSYERDGLGDMGASGRAGSGERDGQGDVCASGHAGSGDGNGPGSGMAWLRSSVSRFSIGGAHARRRGLVLAALTDLEPDALRQSAAHAAALALGGGWPADGGTGVARSVPATVLGAALGFDGDITAPLAVVARGYFPGGGATVGGPAGDAAVAALVAAGGGVADDGTAARIGLLVQGYDAIEGLLRNAVRALARYRPAATVPAVLEETLRHAPPVPVQRRVCVADAEVAGVCVAAGTPVVLDIAAANRDPAVFTEPDRFDPGRTDVARHLTFGTGLRPCPGTDQARALAAGVLEAMLETLSTKATSEAEWVARTAALIPDEEER